MGAIQFRANYWNTKTHSFYSGRLHYLSTTALCWTVIIFSVLQIQDLKPLELLVIPLSFVYSNLVEYWIHRGPLHNQLPGIRFMFHRHTIEHHAYYTDDHMAIQGPRDVKLVLFPAVFIVLLCLIFALPLWLMLEAWLGNSVASLFTATSFFYLWNYETFHLIYHLPEGSFWGRLPGMTLFRKAHTLHHKPTMMKQYNFNVVYPISDLIFGTFRKDN